MRTTVLRSTLAMAFMLGLPIACGDDEASDEGTVQATLKDFSIDLDKNSAPAGTVKFKVHNDGPSIHEFVVFKTDLAPDALPMNADETLVEEGGELEPVDEIEDIGDGDDPDLTVDLQPGSYVIICNVELHYKQGMRTAFTVT